MTKFTSLALLTFMVVSCGKGPETLTITSDPLSPVQLSSDSQAVAEAEFRQLRLGEAAAIESLDPLFAGNSSELRMLSLIYDGLVRIGDDGNPAPALASHWQVNADSTVFTFTLRNTTFHASPIFGGNSTRKVQASDVKFVFERMASILVPGLAYSKFEEIKGFEDYFNEQHLIKNPAKRAIKSISGIQIQNDSTVVFQLSRPSPQFLHKLAHPIASIYPQESATGTPPIQVGTGTGPFYLIGNENNAFVLGVNGDYYGEKPSLNRLDVYSATERNLFQMFMRDELDILMEPSISLLQSISDTAGTLTASYNKAFELINTGLHNSNYFYFNPRSSFGANISELFARARQDVFWNADFVQNVRVFEIESPSNSNSEKQLVFAHSTHPSELYMINQFAHWSTTQGYPAALHPSFAISANITLSTRLFPGGIPVFSWETPVHYLAHPGFGGIKLNHEPWNIDLSEIEINGGL